VSTEEPMSIEDRIRTATRAGATLVRDIGPMAAREPARLRRRPAPAARRWGTWGIPLAAAAAVVLVALSLVAVRQFGASAPPTGGPATNGSATTVPRYYVALDPKQTQPDGYSGTGRLIVGDDQTGKAIATVAPPHGLEWDTVRGASDDRTFVVQATTSQEPPQGGPETWFWYLLRIAPGTAHPYQLTKLHLKLPSTSAGVAYALSPDDQELAVESQPGQPSPHDNVVTLGIYRVSSGAELRAWTADPDVVGGPVQGTLSWVSDGRQLAFSVFLSGQRYQLRTLDVTGSGTGLMTASRAVFTTRLSGDSTCYSLSLTPDGRTAICATQYAFVDGGPGTNADCANGGLEFTDYSVRTGKPVRVLYQYRGACHNGISTLQWTNASGTEIIGATAIDVANQGGKQTGQLGVITDGNIRLLKLPKSVSPTYYGIVAF
jgi:hypothetical protein